MHEEDSQRTRGCVIYFLGPAVAVSLCLLALSIGGIEWIRPHVARSTTWRTVTWQTAESNPEWTEWTPEDGRRSGYNYNGLGPWMLVNDYGPAGTRPWIVGLASDDSRIWSFKEGKTWFDGLYWASREWGPNNRIALSESIVVSPQVPFWSMWSRWGSSGKLKWLPPRFRAGIDRTASPPLLLRRFTFGEWHPEEGRFEKLHETAWKWEFYYALRWDLGWEETGKYALLCDPHAKITQIIDLEKGSSRILTRDMFLRPTMRSDGLIVGTPAGGGMATLVGHEIGQMMTAAYGGYAHRIEATGLCVAVEWASFEDTDTMIQIYRVEEGSTSILDENIVWSKDLQDGPGFGRWGRCSGGAPGFLWIVDDNALLVIDGSTGEEVVRMTPEEVAAFAEAAGFSTPDRVSSKPTIVWRAETGWEGLFHVDGEIGPESWRFEFDTGKAVRVY